VVSFADVLPADRAAALGPVTVTHSGLARASLVGARSLAGTAAVLLLATTTPLPCLVGGLRRLRVPEAVVDIAVVMYRLIFALLDAVAAIREAQAARLGYASARSARQSIGVLAAAVLRRAWDRSRRLEEGLAGRGFGGSLRTLSGARPVSAPFVAASLVLVGGLALWSAMWR
jgi:cobalt/nickel transport system permease protein